MGVNVAYYNESVYLDDKCNKDALQIIDIDRNCLEKKKGRERELYAQNIQDYDNYINIITEFINMLNISDNVISVLVVLKLLIERGLFSSNNTFKYKSNISGDISSCLGMNVIKGEACCRHIANFQHDILTKLGYTNYIFYCYFTDKNMENACNHVANHVINMIGYNGNIYAFDTCSMVLFKFVSAIKMKNIYSDRDCYLYYKPYIDMIFKGLDINSVKSVLYAFDKLKDKDILDEHEYYDICDDAKKMIRSEERLINHFNGLSSSYAKRIMRNWK